MDRRAEWVERRFQQALDDVLEAEGGFVDHPDDPGGATNLGISMRLLKRVRRDVDGDGDVDIDDVRQITPETARSIYRRIWWDSGGGNPAATSYRAIAMHTALIEAPTLLFGFSVNVGYGRANKLLQRALRCLTGTALADDGIIGPATMSMLERVGLHHVMGDSTLALLIRSEAAGHYRQLAASNVRYKTFLAGWLNRAYSAGRAT